MPIRFWPNRSITLSAAHHHISSALQDHRQGRQLRHQQAWIERWPAPAGHCLPALRQDMEQGFGYDFSQVRVHTGTAAEQSARDVNAQAYTVGRNIVFGAGRFVPGSHEGRDCLPMS